MTDQAAAAPYPIANGNVWFKRRRVILVAALMLVVWALARFGTLNSTAQLPTAAGAFSQPVSFVARPGAGFDRINVRSGPGGEYRIKAEILRGTAITGIARATDTRGAFWIELSDGQGFAKETVLARPGDG